MPTCPLCCSALSAARFDEFLWSSPRLFRICGGNIRDHHGKHSGKLTSMWQALLRHWYMQQGWKTLRHFGASWIRSIVRLLMESFLKPWYAWVLVEWRIIDSRYLLAQHVFGKVSRVPLFCQVFTLCQLICRECLEDDPQCRTILGDVLASCVPGETTLCIIYTVSEDLSANCLGHPWLRRCGMTTPLAAGERRNRCRSLENPLCFVLKPGLDGLTDATVNINIDHCMNSYLCEIRTNGVVVGIHCCCDVFSDGFDDLLTVSTGCPIFCEDPRFSGIDENLFDIILDPCLRHCVNIRVGWTDIGAGRILWWLEGEFPDS